MISQKIALRQWIQPLRFVIQVGFMAGLIVPWLPHAEWAAGWLFWTVLAVGVFFCGWVCPFGAAQEWLGWVAHKAHLPRFQMPLIFQKYAQLSRYVWAALILFAGVHYSFLSARFYFNDNLFHGMLTWASGLTLLVFGILSLFTDRPFCNYFCMKGAMDGLMSMVRPVGIRRDNAACIHCQLCEKACPMHVRVAHTHFVRHPNCINCMKCLCVCPKNCLAFRLMTIKKKQK
ncbi:MAG: 4Fe-4S binding protein [Alphaproteobacteria bacterium]